MVTFDVLVVATVARLLTQVLTLLGNISYLESLHIAMALLLHLLAGDEWSDGDTVLLAHHTLGRRLVHLGGAGLGVVLCQQIFIFYILFKERTRAVS